MTQDNTEDDPLLLPRGLGVFGKIKFLAKDAGFYGGMGAIAKFSSLFSFPVISRVLEKTELSTLDIVGVFETLVIVTFVFGQDRALARFLHEEEDVSRRRSLVVESLLSLIGICLIGIGVLYIFLDQIIEVYGLPLTARPIFLVLLAKLPFTLVVFFSVSLLKWTFARKKFVILNLGLTFSVVGVSIVVAIISSNKIFDMVLAQTIVQVIFACVALFLIRDWLSWKKLTGVWKKYLVFAASFGVVNIVETIVPSIDRGSVANMFGLETLAIYSVANRIASLFQMWSTAFRVAWSPFQLSLFKEDDFEKTFREITLLYSAAAGFVMLGLNVLGPYIIYLLAGEKYMESINYIAPLIAGLAIQTISWVTGAGNFLAKKSSFAMYGSLTQVVFLIIGIALLSPFFGLYGVAWAVFISYLAEISVATFLAFKVMPMQLPLLRVTLFIGWATALSSWVTRKSVWSELGSWDHIVISITVLLMYLIPVWFLGLKKSHRQKAYLLFNRLKTGWS